MKLLLLGATGLVGRTFLDLALRDPRVERVTAPVRRPIAEDGRLQAPVTRFDALPEDAEWWSADAAVCALGTTRRAAGLAEVFRHVDHDIALAAARLARRGGTPAFALVSARGANPRSPFLYPRVKGELEASVERLGFPSLTILRPGLIGGTRAEPRPAERMAQRLLARLDPVLPAGLRINPAERIAARLLEAALAATPGRWIVDARRMT